MIKSKVPFSKLILVRTKFEDWWVEFQFSNWPCQSALPFAYGGGNEANYSPHDCNSMRQSTTINSLDFLDFKIARPRNEQVGELGFEVGSSVHLDAVDRNEKREESIRCFWESEIIDETIEAASQLFEQKILQTNEVCALWHWRSLIAHCLGNNF